jgi:hypothetical protein
VLHIIAGLIRGLKLQGKGGKVGWKLVIVPGLFYGHPLFNTLNPAIVYIHTLPCLRLVQVYVSLWTSEVYGRGTTSNIDIDFSLFGTSAHVFLWINSRDRCIIAMWSTAFTMPQFVYSLSLSVNPLQSFKLLSSWNTSWGWRGQVLF